MTTEKLIDENGNTYYINSFTEEELKEMIIEEPNIEESTISSIVDMIYI